jgi:outer membrane protein TolC
MRTRSADSLCERPLRGLAAATLLALAGCATDRLDLAPPRHDQPWPLPAAPSNELRAATPPKVGMVKPSRGGKPNPAGLGADGVNAPADPAFSRGNEVTVRADHAYNLAGLIDLAQRSNPETREAWERARQAALAVGLTESAYLPQITAEAIAGWQRTPLPIPQVLVPEGYFVAKTYEVVPMLTAKWLLFDFGQRAGAEAGARANSFVANVAFTGAHQKLIYAVSRDYFALGAARARLKVAEQSQAMAKTVEDAAAERRANGLATVVELAQAQQQAAQARFNVERAKGGERSAYSALLDSLGVAPSTRVEIQDSTALPLPAAPSAEVDDLVSDALATRPDILAAWGKIKAAQAKLDTANASFYPTIGLEATAYQNIGAFSTQGSPYYTVNKPGGTVMLKLSLPLFDGGDREAKAELARSEIQAAHAALDRTRDSSARQVTDAHDALKTAFAEYEAALVMERTSQTAYDAALEAYRNGVGLYTDVVNAETGLSQGRFEKENAHANVLTAAAALAFATGSIRAPGG